MEIRLAKSAGFCFGVDRAVNIVNTLLEKNPGQKIYTLGPIIHNPQLVKELEEKGAVVTENPDVIPTGSTVVIRTHGVSQAVSDHLSTLSLGIIDATCPYVSKIHKIVQDATRQGKAVLIAGDPDHPEVEGIKGHCEGESYVYRDIKELEELSANHPELKEKEIIAVAQTTFNTNAWGICRDFIEKVYTKAFVFDTICSATSIRQQEAQALAQESDLMIIIGGRQSSNTAKLYTVCSAICPSYLIESAAEVSVLELNKDCRIGVTAGASTPACIIKEVLKSMTDLENKDKDEISFAEALELSFKTLSNDEIVKGVVIGVAPNEIEVDLGTKHAGYIPFNELTDDSSARTDELVKVGDELDLVVLHVNDQDGTVMLSKKRFDSIKGWEDIVKASEEDITLTGTVIDVIKGGVLALVNGVRVFIPASQTGVSRNDSLDALKGQTVNLKIIETNRGRRRAVGSIKLVQKEERKQLSEKFWSEAAVGNEYQGRVKSLTSYGAFIDLGGVDGMVHISELSWSRIKHPSEVLNVGDIADVYIKDIHEDTKKISLGYKGKGENPWETFLKTYKVGDVVDVKVVSFMPFGAFAQILPGVDGLIHISQISDKHIAKPADALEIGQTVKVKILEIEEDKKRISLSMKEAAESEGPAEGEEQ